MVLLLLLADSLVPKSHFQLTKKSPKEVPEKVRHSAILQMAWQLWLATRSKSTLFQPMIARVISGLYYNPYLDIRQHCWYTSLIIPYLAEILVNRRQEFALPDEILYLSGSCVRVIGRERSQVLQEHQSKSRKS